MTAGAGPAERFIVDIWAQDYGVPSEMAWAAWESARYSTSNDPPRTDKPRWVAWIRELYTHP